MTTKRSSRPIVLVTGTRSRESRLRESLADATERAVRTISVAELETVLDAARRPNGDSGFGRSIVAEAADERKREREPNTTAGSGSGAETGGSTDVDLASDSSDTGVRPAAVVLESDAPSEVRNLLERVREAAPTVPTIVAPLRGSERLATVALRADADEYVPADDDAATDRILETIADWIDRERDQDQNQDQAPEWERSKRTDRRYRRILANELPDEAFVISEDGTYLEAQVRPESADLYAMPPDELIGNRLEDVFPDDTAGKLHCCLNEALETESVRSVEYEAETTEGTRRFEARVVPADERIDDRPVVVWLARDITERAERERELRSRQSELETLNRINAIVRQVIETLVEAPARNTIEREVCEQLVDSDLYCGSLIVERTGNDTLSHRISAGEAETYLERARDLDVDHERPIERAARTGDAQMVNRILETDPLPPELQTAAREDNVRAAIAVPITYEDATYGVLTVLASRKDAFTDSEKAEFELLGETIGFTIMAVKNRQLLLADTVVELEFRIDGGDTFSFDLSERYGCTCSLEWAGTTAKGRTFQYVTIDGLEGETVLEEARAHDSIEECRLIHDGMDQCTIEMRLCKSGVRTLTNHGATIRDISVEDGVGRCLVEVSQNADIREIADALSMIYENTELVARREVDRPVRTAAERRKRILDELTDRQLTTLRLAYYGGFFDWPRESTGEEIAEAMNVSPPTMHQHLRKGLKAILGEFFEEGGGTRE